MSQNIEDGIEEMERQLSRASYHTQTTHTRMGERMNESEQYLFGLLDLMLEKGLITEEELEAKLESVKDEIAKRSKQYTTGVMLFTDGGMEILDPGINCDERLHICKAACCRLSFALSLSDLEVGKVKWDFGKPYYIRHTASGHCVHLDQGSCHCGVYDHRPKICRGYSCQDDQRIWIDFDKMVLNQEWIDQHLGGEKLVLKTNELSQKKKSEE